MVLNWNWEKSTVSGGMDKITPWLRGWLLRDWFFPIPGHLLPDIRWLGRRVFLRERVPEA